MTPLAKAFEESTFTYSLIVIPGGIQVVPLDSGSDWEAKMEEEDFTLANFFSTFRLGYSTRNLYLFEDGGLGWNLGFNFLQFSKNEQSIGGTEEDPQERFVNLGTYARVQTLSAQFNLVYTFWRGTKHPADLYLGWGKSRIDLTGNAYMTHAEDRSDACGDAVTRRQKFQDSGNNSSITQDCQLLDLNISDSQTFVELGFFLEAESKMPQAEKDSDLHFAFGFTSRLPHYLSHRGHRIKVEQSFQLQLLYH